MTSGMRKAPPISTSSPRETITSLPRASAASVSSTAAALLLTTVAASAPVSVVSRSSTRLSRSPRPPVARSYSRLFGPDIIASRCWSASSASSERPRLVWMTVPVRLSTRRMRGARRRPTRASSAASIAAGDASASGRSPRRQRSRSASISCLASPATRVCPCSATHCMVRGCRSSRSIAGRSFGEARLAVVTVPAEGLFMVRVQGSGGDCARGPGPG